MESGLQEFAGPPRDVADTRDGLSQTRGASLCARLYPASLVAVQGTYLFTAHVFSAKDTERSAHSVPLYLQALISVGPKLPGAFAV